AECRTGTDCFNGTCRTVQAARLTLVGLPSDAYVRLFSSHDGHSEVFGDTNGNADGSPVTKSFTVIDSLKVRAAPDSRVKCSFDNADVNGDWVWSAATTATPAP